MTNQDWMERKLEEQRRLYEQYGKALERDHTGEFVAISLDGDILLDRKMGKLLRRATDTFGRDNFAMARVGYEAMTEWMSAAYSHPSASGNARGRTECTHSLHRQRL